MLTGSGAECQLRALIGILVPFTLPPTVFPTLAAYCADRRASRPPTWTRSLRLDVPVRDVTRWGPIIAPLTAGLSFLSGDDWRLTTRQGTWPQQVVGASGEPVDAVCLFSGGLDSFTGALDLLAEGKRVCLVSHYEGGPAPAVQLRLARRLRQRFGAQKVALRTLFLRPAPAASGQARPLPRARESSTRSLLFLAAGLTVAAGYGSDVPLYIPENGFIGINVPLTSARSGSFSTRTTHPYVMSAVERCAFELGITNPIRNPFRLMTKGEIIVACRDQDALRRWGPQTLSCAHPEASRYASRPQGNCGYCFPCLIRRSAFHHVGFDNPAEYSYDALLEDSELTGDRGSDLRAMIPSLTRSARPIDVLRNGPVAGEDVAAFGSVYERGRRELLSWMTAAVVSPHIRRQLPTS
jgi:7-cyano-7-deazaguanine synthase in queuosine biosynthesis